MRELIVYPIIDKLEREDITKYYPQLHPDMLEHGWDIFNDCPLCKFTLVPLYRICLERVIYSVESNDLLSRLPEKHASPSFHASPKNTLC